MKILYPSINFIRPKYRKVAWYHYLLKGFENNYNVSFKKELADFSYDESGKHLTCFEIENEGKLHKVIYDWGDFIDDHYDYAKELGAAYFKIQTTNPEWAIGQTVKLLEMLDNLEEYRNINKKEYDICGVFMSTEINRRLNAVKIIRNMKHVNSKVGMHKMKTNHNIPEEFIEPRMSPDNYFRLQCKSKLNLVLSGAGGKCAFSWRLPEALAMGCAIVTHEHVTYMPNHKYFEKNCIITVKDNLEDLEDKINYYLENEKERIEIANNARNYFDEYLTPEAMAENIIKKVIK